MQKTLSIYKDFHYIRNSKCLLFILDAALQGICYDEHLSLLLYTGTMLTRVERYLPRDPVISPQTLVASNPALHIAIMSFSLQ